MQQSAVTPIASSADAVTPTAAGARSRRPAQAVVAVGVAALTTLGIGGPAATAQPLPGGAPGSGIDLKVPAPLVGAPEAAVPAVQPINLARAFAAAGALYATTNSLAKPAAKPARAAAAAPKAATAPKAAKVDKVAKADKVSASTRSQVAAARKPGASRSKARVVASGSPRSVGRALAAQKGWGAGQFACLDKLWTKESNWRTTADNPTSSAYGIPQALPGKRMASHGRNWRTDAATQIRWGLDYIDDRYGAPCKAWAHSRANNWY